MTCTKQPIELTLIEENGGSGIILQDERFSLWLHLAAHVIYKILRVKHYAYKKSSFIWRFKKI